MCPSQSDSPSVGGRAPVTPHFLVMADLLVAELFSPSGRADVDFGSNRCQKQNDSAGQASFFKMLNVSQDTFVFLVSFSEIK